MKYQVTVCEAVPQAILRLPREIRPDRLGEDIVEGMHELTAVAQRVGLTASGAATITYQDGFGGGAMLADFAVPLEPGAGLGPRAGAEVVVLPGMLVARTCHRGGYDSLADAYNALRSWIHDSGYLATGPATEVYLIGPDEVVDPARLVTEIRIPVIRSAAVAAHSAASFDLVLARTHRALKQTGFLVISEFDVRATLRTQLEEDIGDHVLVTAYHPALTLRAIRADPLAGSLMPIHVVVRRDESGVAVWAADPTGLAHSSRRRELYEIADEIRELLVATLAESCSPT